MVRNGQNYRKGGKNFQIFEKLFINSKKYKSFENFTHWSSDIQLQIPGDSAGGIHNRFFQVLTHVLSLHFNRNFIIFHGQMNF